LQKGLLSGLETMIAKQKSTIPSTDTARSFDEETVNGISSKHDSTLIPDQYQDQCYAQNIQQPLQEPILYIKPSNFLHADGSVFPEHQSFQEHPIDDWIWDLVMNDDCNMFTV
jgi:hypothetical protein